MLDIGASVSEGGRSSLRNVHCSVYRLLVVLLHGLLAASMSHRTAQCAIGYCTVNWYMYGYGCLADYS